MCCHFDRRISALFPGISIRYDITFMIIFVNSIPILRVSILSMILDGSAYYLSIFKS